MFTLSAMVSILFSLIIIGLICWVLLWVIGAIGLSEPFNKVARVVVILFAAYWVISLLLPFTAIK